MGFNPIWPGGAESARPPKVFLIAPEWLALLNSNFVTLSEFYFENKILNFFFQKSRFLLMSAVFSKMIPFCKYECPQIGIFNKF